MQTEMKKDLTPELSQETKYKHNDLLCGKVLSKFLKENPEHLDFANEFESVLVHTLQFSEIANAELTGSFARFAAGFGKMDRYHKGKDGARNLYDEFNNPNNNRQDLIGKTISKLAFGDIDMDYCFTFNKGSSLSSLFDYSMNGLSNLSGFLHEQHTVKIGEREFKIKSFSVLLANKYKMSWVYEPVETNPRFKKLTVSFSVKTGDEYKQFLHVDMSEYPKNGVEARSQKRHGGRTLRSQDRCRLPLYLSNNEVCYKLTHEARMSLVGQEYMDVSGTSKKGREGKNVPGIAELALRALRIRLIHVPDVNKINVNNITSLFDSKTVFAIRNTVENYVLNGGRLTERDMIVPLKELILSFNYDPYLTLQVLQDTGLYLLFPGLRGLSGSQWKKLYLNEWLNLAPQSGEYLPSGKRSLNSLIADENEYIQRDLNDGMSMILHAIHEIKSPNEEFHIEKAFEDFLFGNEQTTEDVNFRNIEPAQKIEAIMRNFNGGLTEIEIQKIYNSLSTNKLSDVEFRSMFLDLKFQSKVDKQLRKINVFGKEKNVLLYSLRNPKSLIPIEKMELFMGRTWFQESGHPYINRAKEYAKSNQCNIPLVRIISSLEDVGVPTLESLRSLSVKDFEYLYLHTVIEGSDIDNFKNGCRILQIIAEDVLRYPQFLK